MLVNITKKLVIVFIIGILVGAIITTAGFLIFSKVSRNKGELPNQPGFSQSDNSGLPGFGGGNGQLPELPGGNSQNGGNPQNGDSGQLPGNGSQQLPGGSSGQLPEAPGGNNSNSSSTLPGTNSF